MERQTRVLRRLFLTLVLRGATADGLPVGALPLTVPAKLGGDMLFFAMCGSTAFYFLHRSLAAMSLYLHGATFVLVGVFLVNAAADVLANPDEATLLSHLPVTLRRVVAAKALVLGELALWLAGAFNVVGLAIAPFVREGSWRFIPAHILSVILNVGFALGCVLLFHRYRVFRHAAGRWSAAIPWAIVALYAAGLAWALDFKLDGFVSRVSPGGTAAFLFPPSWFAALDTVVAGRETAEWPLAVGAVIATGTALAFGLVGTGGKEMRWTIGFASRRGLPPRTTSRLLRRLMRIRLVTWGLRTPAAHAAFAVTILYLARNRDLRFRLLSALTPVLVMPWLLWLRVMQSGPAANFWTLVMGIYFAVCVFLAVQLIETSSDWRAARVFRFAPLPGPGELCAGARRAVIVMTVPIWILYFGGLIWLTRGASAMILLVPAIVAVPLFARLPNLVGTGVPLISPPSGGASQKPLQVMSKYAMYSVPIAALFAYAGTLTFWILVGLEAVGIGRFLIRTRRYVATLPWT